MQTTSFGRNAWIVNSRAMVQPLLQFQPAPNRLCEARYDRAQSRADLFEDVLEPASPPVVVVPTDFSSEAALAVRTGISVASNTEAKLVFCHAVFSSVIPLDPASPSWVTGALRSEAEEQFQPVMELARRGGVDALSVVEEGPAAGVILKVARRYAANLIILTSRARGVWARLLFGPGITEQVRRAATCQLMILERESELESRRAP